MSPQNWLSGDGTLLCLQWTAFLLLPFMRAPELKGKDTWIITRTQYAQDFVGVPQSCSPCLVPWRHGAGFRPLSAPGFYLGLLDPDNVWTRSSSFLFSVGLKPSGGHWSSFCYAILQSAWIDDDSQKNIPWGAEQNEWILNTSTLIEPEVQHHSFSRSYGHQIQAANPLSCSCLPLDLTRLSSD